MSVTVLWYFHYPSKLSIKHLCTLEVKDKDLHNALRGVPWEVGLIAILFLPNNVFFMPEVLLTLKIMFKLEYME